MLALGLILALPVFMWLGQSALYRIAGLPLSLRISTGGLPRRLQRVSRVLTNLWLAGALLAYPFLCGETPLAYYARLFPMDRSARHLGRGLAASIVYLGLLYCAWVLTDNVRFGVRHSARRLMVRLAPLPLAALLGAGMEELLFRGVLLQGLLNSFNIPAAMTIGVVVFAAAHYVRQVKRRWTFVGHLALGSMLCTAFLCTRTLWLPIGLHAGGIFIIMAVRPFVRYTGPGWLVGASIFPYAGATGVVGLTLLALNIWYLYGASR